MSQSPQSGPARQKVYEEQVKERKLEERRQAEFVLAYARRRAQARANLPRSVPPKSEFVMNDRLPCPHCGEMFTNLWDYNWDGKEEIYTKCGSCDKSVDIIRRESVSYELVIPPAYKDDETLHERE